MCEMMLKGSKEALTVLIEHYLCYLCNLDRYSVFGRIPLGD